jgi:hypothetical protein
MSDDWNPQVYRKRARRWRDSAVALPPGDTRNAHITLAEGYENLVRLIEIALAPQVACDHSAPVASSAAAPSIRTQAPSGAHELTLPAAGK